MRKLIFTVCAVVIAAGFQMSLPAQAVNPSGRACTKVGALTVYSGKKFTCVKSGTKKVWNKGTVCSDPSRALWVNGKKYVCRWNGTRMIWRLPEVVTPTPTPSTSTPTPPPTTPPAIDIPSDGTSVSNTSLNNKVLMGYQAWFECRGTYPNLDTWIHWFDPFTGSAAANLTVDLWPDITEYTSTERCATSMKTSAGNTFYAYSSSNNTVIQRHFSWMQKYKIDGVALQAFVTNLSDATFGPRQDLIISRVSAAAQKYGRVFYIEYDMSSQLTSTQLVNIIKADWKKRVDAGVTTTSAYLHDGGKPVVEIWGAGIPGGNNLTAADLVVLQDFFRNNPDPKYRATLIGGIGSFWRTGTGDAQPGADWAAAYRGFDVINPWAVGRFGSTYPSEGQWYLDNVIAPDLAETTSLGIRYMPVLWPGFTWKNLMDHRSQSAPSNQIPRRCGAFFWQQAINALSAGAAIIQIAMFDEVDEGTAMMKLAPVADDLPVGANLVPLNIDGCSLDSDFYLRMAAAVGEKLKAGAPFSRSLPIELRPTESLNGLDFSLGLPNPA